MDSGLPVEPRRVTDPSSAAADIDPRNAQGAAGLSRDRTEDHGRRGLPGHERRDPAQRLSLPLGQAAKLVTHMGI